MERKSVWQSFWTWLVIAVIAIGLTVFGIWQYHQHQTTTHHKQAQTQAKSGTHSSSNSTPSKNQTSSANNKSSSSNQKQSSNPSSKNNKSSQNQSTQSKGNPSSSNKKQTNPSSKNNSGSSSSSSGKNGKKTTPKLVWGIDTASKINSSFYQCVTKNYGKPVVVGRYMLSEQGVYTGLNQNEVKFLHRKGVKILPIYNKFSNASGKSHGVTVAHQAIQRAKKLGVPKGSYLAADIELQKQVNAGFLMGWTQTILNAGYKPSIYGNFVSGHLNHAYNQASSNSSTVKNHLMLWTNQPSIGITTKSNAPNQFNATSPNHSQTDVWQYGINGNKCNIDTDLIKGSILNSLW